MTITLDSTERFPALNTVRVFDVPLLQATADTLGGYGHPVFSFADAEVDIVTWPASGWRPIDAGTGRGAITEGAFNVYREGDIMFGENHAVNGRYITGWFGDPAYAQRNERRTDPTDPRKSILTAEANYHPDSGQIFYPRQPKPFVALLALPGDDVTPDHFRAFYFDGRFGIHINAGVWHQPLYPVHDMITFDDKQGQVHACVSCDFLGEFGGYVNVPLYAPAA